MTQKPEMCRRECQLQSHKRANSCSPQATNVAWTLDSVTKCLTSSLISSASAASECCPATICWAYYMAAWLTGPTDSSSAKEDMLMTSAMVCSPASSSRSSLLLRPSAAALLLLCHCRNLSRNAEPQVRRIGALVSKSLLCVQGFSTRKAHAAYTQNGWISCCQKDEKFRLVKWKPKKPNEIYMWVPSPRECFGLFPFYRLPATGFPYAMNRALNCVRHVVVVFTEKIIC